MLVTQGGEVSILALCVSYNIQPRCVKREALLKSCVSHPSSPCCRSAVGNTPSVASMAAAADVWQRVRLPGTFHAGATH